MNAVVARRLGCIAARAGWGALAAVHVPAVAAVGRALVEDGAAMGRVTSVIALALAIVFFVLKAFGVPLLRIRSPQATTVFCLVAALVHAETRAPILHPGIAVPAAVAVVAAVAGPKLCPRGRELARAWTRVWRRLLRAILTAPPLGDATGRSEPEPVIASRRVLLRRLVPPRAPPVTAC